MSQASRRSDLKPLIELVNANYARVVVDLLKPILEFLRLTRLTTGDIESFLILLVIGVRVAEDPRFRRSTVEKLAELHELPTRGTNVRSIAASLDMPRETVRRKVAEMTEIGWIVRHAGGLTLSSQVFNDMAELTRSIEELAARNYVTVSDLLARQQGAEPQKSRTG